MGSAGNAAAKNRQVESVVVVEVSCGNKPGKPDQLIPSAPESAVAVAEQDLNPPDAETYECVVQRVQVQLSIFVEVTDHE